MQDSNDEQVVRAEIEELADDVRHRADEQTQRDGARDVIETETGKLLGCVHRRRLLGGVDDLRRNVATDEWNRRQRHQDQQTDDRGRRARAERHAELRRRHLDRLRNRDEVDDAADEGARVRAGDLGARRAEVEQKKPDTAPTTTPRLNEKRRQHPATVGKNAAQVRLEQQERHAERQQVLADKPERRRLVRDDVKVRQQQADRQHPRHAQNRRV